MEFGVLTDLEMATRLFSGQRGFAVVGDLMGSLMLIDGGGDAPVICFRFDTANALKRAWVPDRSSWTGIRAGGRERME